jgi:hypothetical protein
MASTTEVPQDLTAAADFELVELLDGLYGELLSRVSDHYMDGVGDNEVKEAKPEYLGVGLALAGLVRTLSSAFIDGPLEFRDDTERIGVTSSTNTWNVGLDELRHQLEQAIWTNSGPQWESRDARGRLA